MPSTVPVFSSVECIGNTDCRPLKYNLMCDPLAGPKVTPCLVSQRLNSLEFTDQIINIFVVFIKEIDTRIRFARRTATRGND